MQLFIADLVLNDINISGPVSYNEKDDSFLFVNKANEWDIYFKIKKNNHGKWVQCYGPLSIDKDPIDKLGEQIDEFIKNLRS